VEILSVLSKMEQEDNEIDYMSIILQLQFQNQQLKFQLDQLNTILHYRIDTIKMLEGTLTENRNWDDISNNIKNDENHDSGGLIEEKREIILLYHNIVNHVNKILIKKGLFTHNRKSHKIIQSIQNINIK
jgi:hypothetical protein